MAADSMKGKRENFKNHCRVSSMHTKNAPIKDIRLVLPDIFCIHISTTAPLQAMEQPQLQNGLTLKAVAVEGQQ
jgi:hypothetical protein